MKTYCRLKKYYNNFVRIIIILNKTSGERSILKTVNTQNSLFLDGRELNLQNSFPTKKKTLQNSPLFEAPIVPNTKIESFYSLMADSTVDKLKKNRSSQK